MTDKEINQKPRCFLVTVGASLIGKYIDREVEVHKRTTDIKAKDIEGLQSNDKERAEKEWAGKSWRSKDKYTRARDKITNALKSIESFETFRKSSAELNSLYHIKRKPGQIKDDKVIFFTTRTPVGDLCSSILKEALTDIEIQPDKVKFLEDNIFFRDPEGLGKANDSAFVTEGLPHFISDLSEQIQNHEEQYDVILIPTGGYKSIIPYATLAGILHKKEINYIYEESDKLMPLPPIPVGLDLEQWKPAYVKLEVLTNQPSKNTSTYFNSLDDAFKNLLEPPPDGNQPYKFSAMGEFLKKRYLQLRYHTPLQFQAAGTSLLKYLKRDSDKPDLQKFFSQLIEIGSYFWLGDKVPEMADHALHHHTNLFEIAEILLLPILDNQSDFLSAEELFVLLCTIYFHDWGHVISELDEKPLLPTQIRDFHHILGYQRLKERGWRKELIKSKPGLHWVRDGDLDKQADELWERYLKLIAIIGLFHRKRMPLKEGDTPYPCPVNGKTYVALEKQANNQDDEDKGKGWFLQFEGENFPNERAILIASLFRIIDSLDNQIARMGTHEETRTRAAEEIRMKAAVVKSDAKNEERRCKEIEKMLTQYLKSKSCEDLKQEIDNLIGNIIGSYQVRESTGTTKIRRKSEELDLEEEINKLVDDKFDASESGFAKSLIRLCVDASCWAFFKREQPKHYLKHLALKNPIISYDEKEHIVTVKFRKEEEAKLKEYCEAFDLDPNTDLPNIDKIIHDIEEEYAKTKVESILRKDGLEIVYRSEV